LVVLGLGLLASCREPKPGRAPEHARAPTPNALPDDLTAGGAAAVASASAGPVATPTAVNHAPSTPMLRVTGGIAWARAAGVEPAQLAATHGGFTKLNRLGDELRALAAECRCTSHPLEFQLDDKVNIEDVLSRLGLLKAAGFTQVKVVHLGESIVLQHAEVISASGGATLRVLRGGAFCSTTKSAEPVDLQQLEAARACDGALLSIAEEADWAVAWRAAQALTHGRTPSVRFVLDSQPRTPAPPPPPITGQAIQPVGHVNFHAINNRIKAQYGDLYGCLVRFPVPVPAPPPLAIAFTITANGTTSGVDVIGASAAPQTAACLRPVFQSMVFQVPSHGAIKLRYPFALADKD
jgi:hypothetical protein